MFKTLLESWLLFDKTKEYKKYMPHFLGSAEFETERGYYAKTFTEEIIQERSSRDGWYRDC